ncbi:MAG TPA: nitrogenase component 1 [Methanospirillum sp.]|uniref:nitrogenase component 1 n=1 Tax=Methanospirillum sp. TaxID=45200 RepID=UPI002BE6914C|nr:nitrogenase component 1 [Methanospirillum sp.]HWQ63479.1 nitrogenase component 1 [Methanospirillum sp.]
MGSAEAESASEDFSEGRAIEAPRFSCALGGALGTALGIYGTVPILHSGAGCGIGQLFGQLYAGGQNAGGPQGGTSTPCSSLVEHHVVFGGEEKLKDLIKASTELMEGDLYAVITGCVPSLIGDDVNAVVRPFKEEKDIVYVKTSGFTGNSYEGYELFFEAVINDILKPAEKIQPKTVNIFGIVPYQHVFWKGDAKTIKDLLARIGVTANVFLAEFDGTDQLRNIPAAEYNIVLSTWNGHRVVNLLKEKFETPFLSFPSVPIGPKQTAEFLRTVGKTLNISEKVVESVIESEERRVYRFIEYGGDAHMLVRPHPFFAVVADSGTAIGITRFLVNELGYLPDVIQIADEPPEEVRAEITKHLTEGLETPVKPDVIFETDSHLVRQNLKNRPFLFLYASSLEAPTSLQEFGAIPITVSFPAMNRLILNRTYAGFDGALTLFEETISTFVGPL